MSKSRLIKHNPAFLSKEELLSSFVVRTRELQLLMEIVRNNTGPVNQHVIIIGPRGMGKTMLVRRLCLEIQRHETLIQNWYPVLLPEEMYDVATEGELWLRVLQWVGEQEKEKDQGRLLKIHHALVTEPNDQTLKIRALASLLEFADRKRLLIIVENLQMLLGEQSSDDDAWDIRKTLLNHPELMLVSTATTHFGEIRNAHKANFELFQEILLPPLDTAACRTLWQSITGEDLTEKRIRPMAILTGGSPRLLAILADFGAGRPLKELMDNLVVLIDDHTTYFKANVEALPNKERRVFVTLAELWEPSRAKDVAERSRLSVNNVSALLNRLVERGAVTKVDQKGRAHYYQITERLYNIYHLMRLSGSAGDRVKALVRCMAPIYGETAIACAMAKESCHLDGDLRPWFIKGYESILEITHEEKDMIEKILTQTPQAFFDLPEANYLKTFAKREMMYKGSATEEILPNKEKTNYIHQEKVKEATDDEEQIVENSTFPEENHPLEQVANALVNKGIALRTMGKPDEAVATYDSVVERFGSSKNETLLVLVVVALFSKGVALRAMGKPDEAVTAYDSVVERFGSSKNEFLLMLVATALFIKGVTMRAMGKPDEEVAAYDSVVERFGSSDNESFLEKVAGVLCLKGGTLRAMGKPDEAVTAYDSVVERFGASEDERLLEKVATALVNKGITLGAMGKPAEAVTAFDSVVERFGASEDERLLEKVAKALVNKGATLRAMGKPDVAVTAFDSVVERFGDSEDERLLEGVARALVNKGVTLGDMGKPHEEVTAYDSVVERFGASEDERLLELVANAYNGKAWIIFGKKETLKLDAAIQFANDATRLFPENNAFRHTLACIFGLAGRWPEALEQAGIFTDDSEWIKECPGEIIDFFVNAAAAGETEAALKTIKKTAAANSLEPLVAALKMSAGVDFHVPKEVMEVASDIVKKIDSCRSS
jgi:tetratricopeptide (TPR) repeat protein/predicted transcriptional regulator